ncbi:zinc finger protein Gfi-1b-like isoform X2 [Ornithodoros turicata]|uniref:zinc finger protein Gfi-1b-like isoform X2 n=1 Tax=Ornithodoros turicata TaxID=34597 RepID=UPI003139A313
MQADKATMDYINTLMIGAHRESVALPSLILVPNLGELVHQLKHDVHYVVAPDEDAKAKTDNAEDDLALELSKRDAKSPDPIFVPGDAIKVSGLDFLGTGDCPAIKHDVALGAADYAGVQFIKVETYEDQSLNLDGFTGESPLLHENSKDVALSNINQDPSMLLDDLTKHSTAFEETADMAELFASPLAEQNTVQSSSSPTVDAYLQDKENKTEQTKEGKSVQEEDREDSKQAESPAICTATPGKSPGVDLSSPVGLNVLPVDSVILGNFLLVPDAMSPVKFQVLHEDGTTIKEVSINAICKLEGASPLGRQQPSSKAMVEAPVRKSDTPKASRPFRCEMCSATFNRLGNYTRHQKIHTVRTKEDERFHCDECGKSFIQRCDLTRHLHVHAGTEPHRCSLCGKGYIRHSDLVTHQRFHNKEKPFGCPHCAKGFSQRGDLNRHLRSIHLQVKPLMCGHCHKKFAKEATLIRHMRTSHREMLLQSVLKGR